MEERNDKKLKLSIYHPLVQVGLVTGITVLGIILCIFCGGQNAILISVGLIFGLMGLICYMGRSIVHPAVMQITFGWVCIVAGFVLPIAGKLWPVLPIMAIFGVCGVIVVIKGINKLTGKEGGAVDQAIDEKLDAVGDAMLDAALEPEKVEKSISPLWCVGSIIKGIFIILVSSIFIGMGGFCVYKGENLGYIFLVAGICVCISGISSVWQGLGRRES